MLIVLDRNLQVAWTWDAFDHLDVNRGPILDDVCTGPRALFPARAAEAVATPGFERRVKRIQRRDDREIDHRH
jgi:hypothetical protein